MEKPDRDKVRLAMQVIAGRHIHWDADFEMLGYNPWNFGYYGEPSEQELRERAAEILLDAIGPPEPEED